MMRKLLLFLGFLLAVLSAHSQTFIGSGGAVPDNAPGVWFPVTVSGLPQNAINASFGVESVCIDISHTYDADLSIYLVAPDQSFIELSINHGGSGHNYTSTCFSDLSALAVQNGSAPFTGTYQPDGVLGTVNNGQDPNQTWWLYVQDSYAIDSGTVNYWSLNFGTHPTVPPAPFTSDLPIIKINTLGHVIVDDPKVSARMQIIDNGPGIRNSTADTNYTYSGWIGVEYRGSYSQTLPKKSLGVETQDSVGNSVDVPLLGMPAENDWILNASYSDKTFIRNVLSYDLSRKMGHYASRSRHVELYVNNSYQGMYIFLEKIKRDSARVNVSKLTPADTAGTAVTGGYILKIDKPTGSGGGGFLSAFPPVNGGTTPTILYDYPDPSAAMPQQLSYIQAYMDSFETALHGPQFTDSVIGYRKYIDVSSFIDYFLIDELSRNVDGYRISSFLHKKKITKDGKLHAGPVWDYDIAWGNVDYYNGNLTNGWAYSGTPSTEDFIPPFWWARFLQDPYYTGRLRCRYNELRTTILSTAALHAFIDSVAASVQEGQTHNFQHWQILGIYVWPNPAPYPTTYAGEIQALKNWVDARLLWLDANMPGTCTVADIEEPATDEKIVLYPNPVNDQVEIFISSGTINEVEITDLQGRKVYVIQPELPTTNLRIRTTDLPNGIYLASIHSSRGVHVEKFLKQD